MRSSRLLLVLSLVILAIAGLGLAVGLVGAVAEPGTMTFGPRVPFGVGSYPIGVVSGHFDSDANLDLAVTSYDDDNVSILLGEGDGNFTSAGTVGVGNGPLWLTSSDFNGDGLADLAVANGYDTNLSVLTSDGDGGFSHSSTPTVGWGPWDVAAGDIDNDGKIDLAAGRNASQLVVVLSGDGAGGFSSLATVTVGQDPIGVAVPDLDGDGNLDLVASSFSSDSVSVLLGDGTGGFSYEQTLTVTEPYGVTSGDFNGDGRPDLAVPTISTDSVSIFLGDGTGGFSEQPAATTGADPFRVAAADLDGDGFTDLATANNFGQNLSVLRGDGSGGFSNVATLTPAGRPSSVAVGDFNSDGRPDLAATEEAPDTVATFANETLFDSSLALSSSPGTVSYNQTTILRGNLMSDWRLIAGRTDVQVWRKGAFDFNYYWDGLAAYDLTSGLYLAPRALRSNTYFQFRFLGAGVWKPAFSPALLVKSRASLSQPTPAPTSPKRNTNFTTSGQLRPRHNTAGSTRLYFYRRVLGRWRYYKSVVAGLTNYSTYTAYAATTKLPYAGSWYARAYHSDASHAANWSAVRYFTVKP